MYLSNRLRVRAQALSGETSLRRTFFHCLLWTGSRLASTSATALRKKTRQAGVWLWLAGWLGSVSRYSVR